MPRIWLIPDILVSTMPGLKTPRPCVPSLLPSFLVSPSLKMSGVKTKWARPAIDKCGIGLFFARARTSQSRLRSLHEEAERRCMCLQLAKSSSEGITRIVCVCEGNKRLFPCAKCTPVTLPPTRHSCSAKTWGICGSRNELWRQIMHAWSWNVERSGRRIMMNP